MGNWSISESASEKDKIKGAMADYLNGLNCVGAISYSTYCEAFELLGNLLDKAYELGAKESSQ